jgi:sugar/nucleoside kinase (ribokinase family)
MKKVLTVGGAMYDIFTQYEDVETLRLCSGGRAEEYVIMRAGRKIEVQQLLYYAGGGAVNTAVSFARAGFSAEAFFKVGTDQTADFIIESFHAESVSTNHVVRTDAVATGRSFIVPGPEGNRSVLVYRGANLLLQGDELPEEAIANADQIYSTSLSGNACHVLVPLVTCAKKYNKPVAVNPGTSQLLAGVEELQKALPFIDILIVNAYEAQLLMGALSSLCMQTTFPFLSNKELPELLQGLVGPVRGCFALPTFFALIHEKGPSVVVVTNGSEGVYVSDIKTIFFHPSLQTHMVSSIGAGDAFGSTFVAGLLQGASIDDALRAGIINSASVIAHLGTQSGLLKKEDLDTQIQSLDKKLLQTYSL